MSKSVHKTAHYPMSPEQVWIAITDPRAIAEWLMPNDFKPIVGHKFRFQVDPKAGCVTRTDCQVLEVDPPRKLVYSWMPVHEKPHPPGTKPAILTWTLTPENGGTRLDLVHEGLEVHPWYQRFGMRFGWGIMLKKWIPKVALHLDASGAWVPGAFPLEKRCYKTKTLSPTELTF